MSNVILRTILLLAFLFGSARAGEITLRVDIPKQIVLPKPAAVQVPGTSAQTLLQLRLTIENGGSSSVQITTLNGTSGPKLLFPALTSRLFDPNGKEVPGGYVAADNVTASAARQDTLLHPGKSLSLPYHRAEPFAQLVGAGTYTLRVSARFHDETGATHLCEAAPVSLEVAFEK